MRSGERMQEHRKKTLLIAIAAVFLAAAVSAPFWFKPSKAQAEAEYPPIPLGTNRLRIGARIFNPVSTQHLWTVVDIDPEYQFPDGEIAHGVKVRSQTNRISVWIPRENLRDVLVVQ